jgi:hypothetical protein
VSSLSGRIHSQSVSMNRQKALNLISSSSSNSNDPHLWPLGVSMLPGVMVLFSLLGATVHAPLALLAPNVGVSSADQQGRGCAVSLDSIADAVRVAHIGWVALVTEQDELAAILLDQATGSVITRRVVFSRDGTFLVEVRGVSQADVVVLGPDYACRCSDAGSSFCECLAPLLSSPGGSTPDERALSVLRLVAAARTCGGVHAPALAERVERDPQLHCGIGAVLREWQSELGETVKRWFAMGTAGREAGLHALAPVTSPAPRGCSRRAPAVQVQVLPRARCWGRAVTRAEAQLQAFARGAVARGRSAPAR